MFITIIVIIIIITCSWALPLQIPNIMIIIIITCGRAIAVLDALQQVDKHGRLLLALQLDLLLLVVGGHLVSRRVPQLVF